MATWTNIPSTALEPGSPARSFDALALRDNPIAIATRAAGAPRVQVASIERFTSSGTFVVPFGVTRLRVTVSGGGGGGGGNAAGTVGNGQNGSNSVFFGSIESTGGRGGRGGNVSNNGQSVAALDGRAAGSVGGMGGVRTFFLDDSRSGTNGSPASLVVETVNVSPGSSISYVVGTGGAGGAGIAGDGAGSRGANGFIMVEY
jgi:hypothetical protein